MNPYNNTKNACYQCKKRHLNCHDNCPDYKEAMEEYNYAE